jgi:hypothetical protein
VVVLIFRPSGQDFEEAPGVRIRTIKPEFWEDEDLGCVSRDARLLFVACFNLADDEGLLRWNPSYVKASVFMYDDDLDEGSVQKIMDELVSISVVFPYRGGKAQQRLAVIPNFHKHQVINRPQESKLPPPSLQNSEVIFMYARRDGWICHLCRRPIPQTMDGRYGIPDADLASPDHLTPRVKGGTDYPTNIKIAHASCNKARGDRPVTSENAADDPLPDLLSESLSESLSAGREGKGREGNSPSSAARPTGRVSPTSVDRVRRNAEHPDFEAWWKLYPRKVSKGDARIAFAKAMRRPDVSLAILTDGVKRYAASVRGKDPQFIVHAATWLNRERWLDELPRLRAVNSVVEY